MIDEEICHDGIKVEAPGGRMTDVIGYIGYWQGTLVKITLSRKYRFGRLG